MMEQSTAPPTKRRSSLPVDCARDTLLKRPLRLAHGPLDSNHGALDFSVIHDLLCRMPVEDVVYRDASGGADARMHRLPIPDWRTQPLAQRLAGETTSLMLNDVHRHDARYRAFLDQILDAVAASLAVPVSTFVRPSAALFLSSPCAVSSYHTDREHNFLFQISGSKTVHVFARHSSVLHELAIAFLRPRKGIHEQYRSELEAQAQQFELTPGQILHIPRQWPHWVQNGPRVSASLSLNFFTRSSLALEQVYKANDRFRHLAMAACAALRRRDSGSS